MNHSDRNPYVGPRPIQQGEPLHGRGQEVRELFNVLQARRIVVLHSPSGAGKSSLVEAGLIPWLKAAKFDVWRTIRVNLDPQGLADIPSGTNRYLLSAMVSLEDELPAEHRRRPAQLAGMNFAEYVRTRPRRRAQARDSVVLIFDQFEELLTVAPLTVAEKTAFFTAVGDALEAANLWALFIVREDYLGAFSPYRDRIPTRLSNTFRLDLLGVNGAREAIEQPALAAGRTFPAVDGLVRDLSLIQVQQGDGTFVAEQGLYVEPVILQVVCRRLWDGMPGDHRSIDAEHVARYADISTALADYYASAVAKCSHGDVAVERAIREWIGGKLIVGGIRSQVRQETGRSAGLDNLMIRQLLDSYIVRSEQRAAVYWFELSHDRLVEPIQLDNRAWEARVLHPLQVQARLWEDGRQSAALLLGAEALHSAEAWASANQTMLTDGEREFLAQSQARRARERAARWRLAALVAAAGVAAVIVGVSVVGSRITAQKVDAALAAAREGSTTADQLRQAAEALRAQAFASFDSGDTEAGEKSWRQYRSLTTEAERSITRAVQLFETAALLDPESDDVREQMLGALWTRAALSEQMDRGDLAVQEQIERIRLYDRGGEYAARWDAPAELRVTSSPPGALVTLERFVDDGGRMQPQPLDSPRATPLPPRTLSPGSYRLRFELPGRITTLYPLLLSRGESVELDVSLPPEDTVPLGFIYIPRGRFLYGLRGAEELRQFVGADPMHPIETDAYLIAERETTYEDYIQYLENYCSPEVRDQLLERSADSPVRLERLAQGEYQLTLKLFTITYTARSGELLSYKGRSLRAVVDWQRLPVMDINSKDAEDYVGWLDRSGQVPGARLCKEREWERAARGADGRKYAGGDVLLPEDANILATYGRISSAVGPDPTGSYPQTRSPFGLLDTDGNVTELTKSPFSYDMYVLRGGDYTSTSGAAGTIWRHDVPENYRSQFIGLRVCVSWADPR